MNKNNIFEFVLEEGKKIFDAAKKINKNGKRFLAIVNRNKEFLGTLTDADIRRGLIKGIKKDTLVKSIYNTKAKFILDDRLSDVSFFIKLFKKYKSIDAIPIINKNKKIINIIFRDEIFLKNKNLDCLILAGGYGKRLNPITNTLAKPLIEFNQKPYICNLIDKLKNARIDTIYISIFYKSNQIKKIINSFYKKDCKSNKIKFIEEKKPLGTIGSLRKVKHGKLNEILVLNSDVIFNVNIDNFLHHHVKQKNSITVVSSEYNFEIPYGVIINKGTIMKTILEKPNYNTLINCGIYILNKNVRKFIKKNESVNMDELLKRALS